MKKINYKNFNWWVLEETSKYKKLLLDGVLNEYIIENICETERFDDIFMSHFNNLKCPYTWETSNINKVLNGAFVDKYLDKNELYNEVRLLTKKEAENLPDEIREIDNWYWYWTNTISENDSTYVWAVNSYGGMNDCIMDYNKCAVRPIIFIKNNDIKLNKLEIIQETTNNGNLHDYLYHNGSKYAISMPQKLIIEKLNKIIELENQNER